VGIDGVYCPFGPITDHSPFLLAVAPIVTARVRIGPVRLAGGGGLGAVLFRRQYYLQDQPTQLYQFFEDWFYGLAARFVAEVAVQVHPVLAVVLHGEATLPIPGAIAYGLTAVFPMGSAGLGLEFSFGL
jgi:hypothetical protein